MRHAVRATRSSCASRSGVGACVCTTARGVVVSRSREAGTHQRRREARCGVYIGFPFGQHVHMAAAALAALQCLGHALYTDGGPSSVGHLLANNMDYIVDGVIRRLRCLPDHPHAPTVVCGGVVGVYVMFSSDLIGYSWHWSGGMLMTRVFPLCLTRSEPYWEAWTSFGHQDTCMHSTQCVCRGESCNRDSPSSVDVACPCKGPGNAGYCTRRHRLSLTASS
jgi:hypothetical protein